MINIEISLIIALNDIFLSETVIGSDHSIVFSWINIDKWNIFNYYLIEDDIRFYWLVFAHQDQHWKLLLASIETECSQELY